MKMGEERKGFPLPFGDGQGTRLSNLGEWTDEMLEKMSGDGEIVVERRVSQFRDPDLKRITWDAAKEWVHSANARHQEDIEDYERLGSEGPPPVFTL